MGDFSLDNLTDEPLMCAVIVAIAVAVIVGFSFGFKGSVQF